jgi:hypothetical protein
MLTRTLAVWLLLAVLMSLNGAFREFALVPALGRPAAETTSVVLGLAIILATTWAFFHRLTSRPTSELVRMALLLLVLTVAFEFLLGRYVTGASWPELLGMYAFWRGETWLLLLAAIALSPLLWGRWLARRSAPRMAA